MESLFPIRTVRIQSFLSHSVLTLTHRYYTNSKLGPRLKVVALIDPALDRASAVLQKKRDSFVVSAYQNTAMYKSIDDFARSMRPEDKPRVIVVGSPPHWRGSDQPGRDLELKLLQYFPDVALFIEKPVATGPYTIAMDIGRKIQDAGNVCSVGCVLFFLQAGANIDAVAGTCCATSRPFR